MFLPIWLRCYALLLALPTAAIMNCSIGYTQDMMAEMRNEEGSAATFESVMPVFRQHCTSCHNDNQPRGGLSMTSLDKILAGSASGPVVVSGKPEESLIYLLTAHIESPKMPPNKPRIPQRELKLVENWIRSGMEPSADASESQALDIALGPPIPLATRDPIRALAIHPSQPWIAIGVDGQVWFADIGGGIRDQCLHLPNQEITGLRFRSNGEELWIAQGSPGVSGSLIGWSLSQSTAIPTIGEESDTIQAFDTEPNGDRFAFGSTSRLLKVAGSDRAGLELKKHTDWILSVAYSNDGLLIASGDRFGGIQVWNAETGEVFASLRGHTLGVTGLGWLSDGETLVSGSLDGTIRLWSMNSLQQTSSWEAHPGGVSSMAVTPSDQIWSTGHDRRICCWPPSEQSANKTSIDLLAPGIAIAIGNQARHLAVSDSEGRVYVAALESENQPLSEIEIPIQAKPRPFAFYAPRPPDRSSREVPTPSESSTLQADAQSTADIDATRQALQEVEEALLQAKKTTAQLERAAEHLRTILQEQELRTTPSESRDR